jgi:hypothetical protein
MTRAEEDALLSDLEEAIRQIRMTHRDDIPLAYVARLLRHALQIVEGEKP